MRAALIGLIPIWAPIDIVRPPYIINYQLRITSYWLIWLGLLALGCAVLRVLSPAGGLRLSADKVGRYYTIFRTDVKKKIGLMLDSGCLEKV